MRGLAATQEVFNPAPNLVIDTIPAHRAHLGHFHTAGVPDRHDLDDMQELNYPAIVRAIRATGYEGYIGHEFVPKGDPVAALRAAYDLCVAAVDVKNS